MNNVKYLNEAKNYKSKWNYFAERYLYEIKRHVKNKSY